APHAWRLTSPPSRAGWHGLRAHNLYPILELHWSAPGAQRATSQQPMPDRDHSVTFWSQVANFCQTDLSVVLELFNEPFPDSNRDTDAAWACWRDGGTCPGFSSQAAGVPAPAHPWRA